MTAQIIPISDSSLPLATSVGPNDLLLMDQVDGTQITGYKTKRLKSAFVGLGFANVCAFGGDPTGVVDVATAFNSAVASLPATGGTVFFPAGIYNFATSVSNTIASGKSVRLMGAGPDSSILSFASGIGMTFTYTDYTSTAHFKDLTFATRSAGTATALTLSQSGTTTAPGDAPNTIFDSVVFRGSDGYVLTNYWTTCINLDKITCVSFVSCDFSGPNPVSGGYTLVGTGVTMAGDSTHPPEQIVFTNCEFNYIGKGITCGNWFQGLMVVNCNFTGGDYGINVPVSITGNSQLAVSNSQFNCKTVGIYTGTAVPGTLIIGCTFFLLTGGGAGIIFGIGALWSIIGCTFQSATTIGNGVVIQGVAGNLGGPITGNTFIGLSTGVWLQAASGTYAIIADNLFSGVGAPILNSGPSTNNVVKDNIGFNPVGAAAITTSASPMTYTAGQIPETVYMAASTSITALTQGGVSILPAATGANVNHTVHLEANEVIIVTYTGTLTMKKMVH